MKKTFQGSCHCQKVKYDCKIDTDKDSIQICNCSLCSKLRWKGLKINPSQITITEGKDNLSEYKMTYTTTYSCKDCNVLVYSLTEATDWAPDYCRINITSLDNISPEEINSITTEYVDGKADTWQVITNQEEINSL